MSYTLEKKFRELFIDVSEDEHPIPFEKIIQLLKTIKKDHYVRMLHRKKPLPLLQFLQENGFSFLVYQGKKIAWEIIIWNKKEPELATYCLKNFSTE